MDTSAIQIRANGEKITASWFNTIKTFLGGLEGFLDESETTIANGIGTPTNITGLTLDAASYTSAVYEIELSRSTDTVDAFSNGRIALQRVAGAWRINAGSFLGDADTSPGGGGVTFSVTEAGGIAQVQYTTNTIAGTSYTGIIKYRRVVFNV